MTTSTGPLPSGEASALGFVPERLERLHRRMQQYVDDGQYAGISGLLVRNGEIADIFATGFRNRELGLPMSRDTIVRVYSMTKIVTSVDSEPTSARATLKPFSGRRSSRLYPETRRGMLG